MPLDFPSNPSDGQVYDGYYFDATAGVWQSNAGTVLPNIFKNVQYTTAQTYLVPATIKGKLGQTASLQEWTDSAGNVLASIDSAGNMTVQSLVALQPVVPPGTLMPYAGATAPTGYLLCQGQEVSRTIYATLFSIIGTTYGIGDNATTFNLPNPNGRVIAGKAASGTFANLGGTGGDEAITLTAAQSGVPAHSHANTLSDPGHYHNTYHSHWVYDHAHSQNISANWGGPGIRWDYVQDGSCYSYPQGIGTAGNGNQLASYENPQSDTKTTGISISNVNNTAVNASQSHSNLQPYVTLNYIIKV